MEQDREKAEESHERVQADDAVEGELVDPDSPITYGDVQAVIGHYHSGPLPSAAEFKRYEEALPGTADRILRMAESDLANERKIIEGNAAIQEAVAKSIQATADRADRQQKIYVLITLLIIVVSTILIYQDKSVPGVLVLIVVCAPVFLMYQSGKTNQIIYPEQPDRPSKD